MFRILSSDKYVTFGLYFHREEVIEDGGLQSLQIAFGGKLICEGSTVAKLHCFRENQTLSPSVFHQTRQNIGVEFSSDVLALTNEFPMHKIIFPGLMLVEGFPDH